MRYRRVFIPGASYFFTLVTHERVPNFSDTAAIEQYRRAVRNPVKHRLVSAARDWPHSTFLVWVDRGVYDLWWGADEMPPLPDWAGRE